MATADEVERFLSDLKTKLSVFGMNIIERKKNRETMAELEILNTNTFCIDEIKKLKAENYFRGPVKDTENQGLYWEFGTFIKSREIYIKINYGNENKPCLLISFHFAEFSISYPLA